MGQVRRWWFDAKAINLRPPNRGIFDIPPMGIKDASFNRFGPAQRHFVPGGLAGDTHDFIIGGSRLAGGGDEVFAWAAGGFNAADLQR